MKKKIETKDAPQAIGPYSQGVSYNGLCFLSGQIGLYPTGELVDGGIEEQTKRVFENLKAVLKAEGLTFDNVLKVNVFLKNMHDFTKVNEVYATYFKEPYPARATVEVSRLPKDVLIEIDIIAGK